MSENRERKGDKRPGDADPAVVLIGPDIVQNVRLRDRKSEAYVWSVRQDGHSDDAFGTLEKSFDVLLIGRKIGVAVDQTKQIVSEPECSHPFY